LSNGTTEKDRNKDRIIKKNENKNILFRNLVFDIPFDQ